MKPQYRWIGFGENLLDTTDFPMKYGSVRFHLSPIDQSIDTNIVLHIHIHIYIYIHK